ncbi:hypothetical protein [Micromonospora sp. KC723]|uniref:hypothetical protein n=1 Tax=Micromonospora sp. KC723 TaxID=2530381 RepID=UPI00140526A5|nr:hypothetical protein [Micromonospora sp. KC723]
MTSDSQYCGPHESLTDWHGWVQLEYEFADLAVEFRRSDDSAEFGTFASQFLIDGAR